MFVPAGRLYLRPVSPAVSSVRTVSVLIRATGEEEAMPTYEYHCDKCDRDVSLTLTLREHEKGDIKCPKCASKSLRPLLSTFMSQTAKKS